MMFVTIMAYDFILSFATNCKLGFTNMFFSTRMDGWNIAYTQRHQPKWPQADRLHPNPSSQSQPSVYDIKVAPQPPPQAKADSFLSESFFPIISYVWLTNLIFLLLLIIENFTNTDSTPPYIDTYLPLFPNFGNL